MCVVVCHFFSFLFHCVNIPQFIYTSLCTIDSYVGYFPFLSIMNNAAINMQHVHNGILFNHKKEWNRAAKTVRVRLASWGLAFLVPDLICTGPSLLDILTALGLRDQH